MSKKIQENIAISKIKNVCVENNLIFKGFENKWRGARNTRLIINCLKNHEWSVSYSNFIYNKTKCPYCNGKKSKNDYLNLINEKCKELRYTLLGIDEFVGLTTKLKIRCDKDEHIWNPSIKSFLYMNQMCPKCKGNAKLSLNEAYSNIDKKCKELNYDFSIPKWKNIKSIIHLKCNKDNYEWKMSYSTFIHSNQKCPKCSNKVPITEKELINKIETICHEKNYKFLRFKNKWTYASKMKIELQCLTDKHIWDTNYINFINQGKGCPKCSNKIKYKTPFENEILNKLNIKYEDEKTYEGLKNKKSLRYDYFIPSLNLLIELNGKEHYQDNYTLKENYQKKISYAKLNNINLIEIPNDKAKDLNYFFKQLKLKNLSLDFNI